MITKVGKRSQLTSVSIGPISVSAMKHLTSGRIYLRPLQQDIKLENNEGMNLVCYRQLSMSYDVLSTNCQHNCL